MMNNSFTVIIPLYNKEPYIKRALESVLNQTYDNFEIIVIDDGSSDKGAQIVANTAGERIRIISQDNAGVSAARNKGAFLAKNTYLAFLDADDTWEPNFLKEISNLIDEFPEAGIFGTNNHFIYPSGKVMKEDFSSLFKGKNTGIIKDYFGLFAEIHKSPFSNSNLCIPKKIYDEFGGYKEGVKLTEDSDLWFRIALKYDIAYNIRPLANYFMALEGSTHTIFEPKEFQVAIMLKNSLNHNQVKIELIWSVKKLIYFQNLSLVKRAILSGEKKFALRKIFNWGMWNSYTKDSIICLVSLFLPSKLFKYFRTKKLN